MARTNASGVPILSTGHLSTLGNWRKLWAQTIAGSEPSGALDYLDDLIAKQGADEPVLADERQMIQLLAEVHRKAGKGVMLL